ncbi:hypothetical protein ASPZODRAFT_66417 [Penicilliopsis zonata CBS 506.65]|uniref:N-acetyltransferase domain-containing protein n=1 Tax=Penicilliopsis zonata CBS 506.65 TaxID=1073090 RepID=A0A1L9SI14_9EURO|nr:hypothetical protein ASPZODRAFT_66417 [Penicilliopsis zonata CBS 506.65]OJJ46777.1 hypothetical protein ASPZODRAFT_66417 [Penicilliopsis zonata CBS 506.65]
MNEPAEFNDAAPQVEELSLPPEHDYSRLSERAAFTIDAGMQLEESEEDEEIDEDYVAVDNDDMNDLSYWFRRPPVRQRTKLDELYPFVQVLTLSNVEDCVIVESAFPEHERCSEEKFKYRLTKCPELSLGMFTLPLMKEGQPKPRPTLVAHVIATRTSASRVTDRSMQLPPNWQSERLSFEKDQPIGHEESGGTVCIHSLAVLPEHQGKQVGSTLMKSYIQRIREAMIADRLAIIAHDHLIPFYESLGFENKGPSACQFGGGGWFDMVSSFFLAVH